MAEQKPATFILFGATGDLAVKKLFPALNSLFINGTFHHDSRIIAVSRRTWDNETFRNFLKNENPNCADQFLARIEYAEVELGIGVGYKALIDMLGNDENDRMAYLSLAPSFYSAVIEEIRKYGILMKGQGKIMLEKPFGTGSASAKHLNELLLSFLHEDQIYRIDHYLGKPTIEEVMRMHEESRELRTLLSNKAILKIEAELLETKGIGGRGASYDAIGAFRDIGQNHLLECLAVILAEYPESRGSNAWQDARAEVLERLSLSISDIRRGQYDGYLDEEGVGERSATETAFLVTARFASGELAGIPLTLRGGKMMPESSSKITISFQESPELPKRIEYIIQPFPSIVTVDQSGAEIVLPFSESEDAYANIIRDAVWGERIHFVGAREILAAWKYTDALMERFETVPLQPYSVKKPFL